MCSWHLSKLQNVPVHQVHKITAISSYGQRTTACLLASDPAQQAGIPYLNPLLHFTCNVRCKWDGKLLLLFLCQQSELHLMNTRIIYLR
eukprot:m.9495 g.9495  ORF g.9495 m.9495 type:complete len:89 (-) comp5460_c0_seq1:3221-3487(-)